MGRLHDRAFLSRVLFIFFLVGYFSGCVGQVIRTDRPKGVYHRIKKGETLWSIARAYRVRVQDLAEINNIDNPSLIEKNEVIFIPDAKQAIDDVMSAIITQRTPPPAGKAVKSPPAKKTDTRPAGKKTAIKGGEGASSGGTEAATGSSAGAEKPLPADTEEKAARTGAKEKEAFAEPEREDEDTTPPQATREGEKSAAETAAKPTAPAKGADELLFDRKRFIWPVKGNIAARFGIQSNGMFYNGIRIAAREGESVVASDSGTIIFSSSIKDYGETVIIKHADNYATVYTNLGSRLVKTDDKVKKGDQIAFLGRAEKTTGTFMNFEIRHRNKARNPLFFLP